MALTAKPTSRPSSSSFLHDCKMAGITSLSACPVFCGADLESVPISWMYARETSAGVDGSASEAITVLESEVKILGDEDETSEPEEGCIATDQLSITDKEEFFMSDVPRATIAFFLTASRPDESRPTSTRSDSFWSSD